MEFISLADYILLPFYLLIIYFFAYRIRNRYYPEGHRWRPYFILGLTVKIIGAIFIGLIYQYYYNGGDTAVYFKTGQAYNSAFFESPTKWLNILMHVPDWYDGEYYDYISQTAYYINLSTHSVSAITALLMIVGGGCFLPTSLLYACLSYTGIWALYRAFASQYPDLTRPIALAVLFIPSTFIWGSGIFKDTVCMFGLGWITYGVFQILLKRNFSFANLLMTIISFYIISIVKVYILVSFVPALLMWVLFTYSHRIKIKMVRYVLGVAILIISAGGIYFVFSTLEGELGQYSLENVVETSQVTREYIAQTSGETGSAYDLGEFDPSLQGMIAKAPAAINVSLFRPYLWEARKPIIFFNAIEATLLLLIFLRVLFSLGISKIIQGIVSSPNIQFCLIFTLIFAFAVGISTYNFGSLSRYRIPCLPMFGLVLVLLFYRYNPPEKKLLGPI